MLRQVFCLAMGLAMACPGIASAQLNKPGDWMESAPLPRMWRIAMRRDAVVSTLACIDTRDGRSESQFEIAAYEESPLSKATSATTTVPGTAVSLPMISLGSGGGSQNTLRWTGMGLAGFEAARGLANALGDNDRMLIRLETVGAQIPSDTFSAGNMMSVVLRCSPKIVSLRQRISTMRDPAALVTLYRDTNDRCRGGSEDENEVATSCAERTELGERLNAVGHCYGREGEAGYQQSWHRCGPRSIRGGW